MVMLAFVSGVPGTLRDLTPSVERASPLDLNQPGKLNFISELINKFQLLIAKVTLPESLPESIIRSERYV